MGIFSKFKDMLFEEVDEPNDKQETKANNEVKTEVKVPPVKEEVPISRQIQPEKKPEPVKEVPTPPKSTNTFESERELFRSDNTFPFPDFDEEEFNNSLSRVNKPKPAPTNVLEYERKKRIEKRTEYGKTEIREVVEKKKFKPSPIISPVYGILNEDYKIEDIKDKTDYKQDNLDIESVRKKAFEPTLEILDDKPVETYYEETVTVKVDEPKEEREQKVKTIDELLEDSSDEIIPVKEDKSPKEEKKKEYDEIDEELDELINPPKEKKQPEFEDDDTLENDLFDLIDSMYDSREDGDE